MERKHQVFVSSTYRDLIEERQQVIHALLELDCIPAGMELFPATDEDAWSLIKEIIDGCDYYILTMAGLYGSTNSEGISFTEIEYDYAISTGKPVIAFLHQDIGALPANKTEKTEKKQNKLQNFRLKAESKHCKYWNSPEDLGGKVSRSLVKLRKKHPSDGWVPGRYAADERMLREIEDLRKTIAKLEYAATKHKNEPPPGIENIEQGSDTYGFSPEIVTDRAKKSVKRTYIEVTWDKLFSYAGSSLIGECSEHEFLDKIRLAYWHAVPEDDRLLNDFDSAIILPYVLFDQIKIQFQALGLVEKGTKKRTVSDKNVYWKLTPYGEKYLIKIKARKKTEHIIQD